MPSQSSIGFDAYINSLADLEFDEVNFYNITYQKLPLYVLETFISEISIADKIPQPAELWAIIHSERASDHKEIPFQIEDLASAYPICLFSLQFYSFQI